MTVIAHISWDPRAVRVGDVVWYTERIDGNLKHYQGNVLRVSPDGQAVVDIRLLDIEAAVQDRIALTHFAVPFNSWREHRRWTWE